MFKNYIQKITNQKVRVMFQSSTNAMKYQKLVLANQVQKLMHTLLNQIGDIGRSTMKALPGAAGGQFRKNLKNGKPAAVRQASLPGGGALGFDVA